MGIIGTFNGWNILALPCDVLPRVTSPSSIEWDPQEAVAENECEFTMQSQVYDWMQSRLDGQVSFPPMDRWSHDAWAAFIRACRGPLNTFLLGDPRAKLPKGFTVETDVPLVNGGSQSGYSLATRGWTAGMKSILLPNDYISIGYRMYSVTDVVDADSSGHATLPVWPPLRETPADGAAIVTRGCKGLFRLKSADNKDSVNPGAYGFSGFAIKEAL
jgi:hypothetical protein